MRGTLIKLLPVIILLQPLAALAEGAIRVLECHVEKACEAAGSCKPASGEMVFNMEPMQLDATGAGNYVISYGAEASGMDATSYVGPFIWNVNGETNTLLANSETSFLWHKLSFNPAPVASITFLRCEFTQ